MIIFERTFTENFNNNSFYFYWQVPSCGSLSVLT
jgi:hypothetical protein